MERKFFIEKKIIIGIRVFHVALRVRREKGRWELFLRRGIFYREVEIWWGVIFTIRAFSKLKTTFCKYWKLIKMKVIVTCVYKEYKVKIKKVQEHWIQLRMKFLLGYKMKILCGDELSVEKAKYLVGVYWGNFSWWSGTEHIFG